MKNANEKMRNERWETKIKTKTKWTQMMLLLLELCCCHSWYYYHKHRSSSSSSNSGISICINFMFMFIARYHFSLLVSISILILSFSAATDGTTIFELLAGENQALLIRRDTAHPCLTCSLPTDFISNSFHVQHIYSSDAAQPAVVLPFLRW